MSKEKLDILIVMIVSTISVFTISIFFVVMVYRYQKRMQQKQTELFRAILNAEEEERKRVARDIHDSLGGLLGATKMLLSEMLDSDNSGIKLNENITKVFDLVSLAIIEARNASNALLPSAISRFGLKGAINDLVKKYEAYFEIELINNCPDNLSEFLQIHIYRILNELFNNARKYSEGNKIELEFVYGNNEMHIYFSDNGKGFNFDETLKQTNGNGLNNIKKRVEFLNGTMEVKNNNGTVYLLNFNLNDTIV